MVELDQNFAIHYMLIGGLVLSVILIIMKVTSYYYHILGLILIAVGLITSFIFGNDFMSVLLFKADPGGFARAYKLGCAVLLGAVIASLWQILTKTNSAQKANK